LASRIHLIPAALDLFFSHVHLSTIPPSPHHLIAISLPHGKLALRRAEHGVVRFHLKHLVKLGAVARGWDDDEREKEYKGRS
jgi:hypothetical protein